MLPFFLCSICSSANKETMLSQFEDFITGRAMSLPGTPDLAEADVNLMSDFLWMYCMVLTEAIQKTQNRVKDACKLSPELGHGNRIVLGQMVYIKKLQRSSCNFFNQDEMVPM